MPRLPQNKSMTTPRKPAASSAPKTAAKPATRAAAAKPVAKTVAKPAAKAPVKAAPKAAAKPAVKAVAKAAPKAAAKPSAKAAPKAVKPVIDTTKRYKLLTGIDDANFCQRVSDNLDAGYELAGSPVMVVKGSTVYVGQALVRKASKKAAKKKKK